MLKLDPVRQALPEKRKILVEVGESLGLSKLKEEAEALNRKTMLEGFWDDPEQAQKLLKKKSAIDNKIEVYARIENSIIEVGELMELAEEMEDEAEADSVIAMYEKVAAELDSFKLETLLNGKYDHNSAVISLHAGAGGVEAMDWAEMQIGRAHV